MSEFLNKWAREPRPASALKDVGALRKSQFESDFFSTPCLEVHIDGRTIRYMASNRLAEKRVESLYTKEPTTIPWLETFAVNDVFFDIGANVGMYSIYASVMTGCKTYAFEPEALNYAELNKNIFLNNLHGQVLGYNIAISDEMKVGELLLGAFGYSYSHHDFNENTWDGDHYFGAKATKKENRLHQGCVSLSVDQLIRDHAMPVPQHIKVDVDGLEDRVFRGMNETLRNDNVKTVLIEIDFRLDSCEAIIDEMGKLGWRYSMDQLCANRKKILTSDQVERIRHSGKGGFNYIFYKDSFYDELFKKFIGDYVPPMAPPA